MTSDSVDTDLAGRLDYPGYLEIERLLDIQHPVSDSHDEMLFIIIHQASELWIKLALHELGAARQCIARDDLGPSFKMFSRFSRIQAQLIQSWDVLSTLTPSEYLAFRDKLGPASGFQSHQYRMLEFMLGNRSEKKLAVFRHRPEIHAALRAELSKRTLHDEALALLHRRGFELPARVLERDLTTTYRADDAVAAVWRAIYADTGRYWDLYELAEKLVDVEDWFRQWRFRHLTTVERIIGMKRGTGGTEGVGYLRRALDISLFPELWRLRTEL
ncbi:MAG: tryptophan 2,3-dioxygenase [Geminicoccaceae bacterium]|nr:tryptophan 2,3-dioxygenase [Geminicoccaceae bacterium]MCB9942757.1 tryptophan 2,3-dioxygenase [Geminicoccaceae bacterium]